MIFITTNYYFDEEQTENDENEQEKNNICFICFENETESNFLLTKLKNQNLYIRNCLCDGWIHIDCLTCWYNIKHTCPICREHMIEIIKPSSDTYLNKITLFLHYNYNIFDNNNNNSITIQITKIGCLLLFITYFIYFFYYYTFFYMLFFVLYFVFCGFYFLFFIIYSYNYHCPQLL
jgi:hypothetical protein